MPRIASFLGKNKLMDFFPMKPIRYIEQVTDEIVARRKAKLDVRDDFIQSMVEHEARVAAGEKEDEKDQSSTTDNNEDKPWAGHLKRTLTPKERLGQTLQFLIAGYETTATAFEFIAYNLAMNQEAQDRLVDDIKSVIKEYV